MGLYSVLETRSLLNPFKHGFYAVQILTHKILRRVLFVPLILLFIASLMLWTAGPFYRVAAVTQTLFYASALLGMLLERSRLAKLPAMRLPAKLLATPYYFCMVYVATMVAVARIIRGRKIDRWETTARADVDVG